MLSMKGRTPWKDARYEKTHEATSNDNWLMLLITGRAYEAKQAHSERLYKVFLTVGYSAIVM